jgi:hypothetical protein
MIRRDLSAIVNIVELIQRRQMHAGRLFGTCQHRMYFDLGQRQLLVYQAPMPEHAPPSQLTLSTPELLYKVCDYLSASDQTRFLRVSSLFFLCASPALWKNVPGISKLLNLIPGTSYDSMPVYSVDGPIDYYEIVSRYIGDARGVRTD